MSDLEKIKKLRQSTGAGFKDCNVAIKEAEGDLNKAAEILRVKGISKASKKMSRNAKEGVVAISGDQNKTSVIEVNCETDFVAKNEDFQELPSRIIDTAFENNFSSNKRRAARTLLDILFNFLIRWLAPSLVFTCEEAWKARGNNTRIFRK